MLSEIIENANGSLKVEEMINEGSSRCCYLEATQTHSTVIGENANSKNIDIVFCLDGILTVNYSGSKPVTFSKNEIMIFSENEEEEVLHFSKSFKCIIVSLKYGYYAKKKEFFSNDLEEDILPLINKRYRGCMQIKNILWVDSFFETMEKMDERDKCAYAEFKTMELLYLISRKDIITVAENKIPCQNTSMSIIVENMKEYMETHLDEKLTIENMCNKFNISPTLFKTIFKSKYGEPVHGWLQKQRMHMAAKYLSTSSMTVLDIAYEVGFGGTSQFNYLFKKYYGMTPTQYRRMSYTGMISPI